eukprot:CAMPEP_0174738140 /NCGR_PEP_ID=MMETSP1094-20130205/69448_1 /TAXON_ID=156173 /ORGANISM="Chrysochromulina brevifilum, Strain UTEX LB 985" /LENGTH=43 /DNA_ID= /DNA_START= /DNA_END= /DNA_ORIENTATION=
MAPVPMSRHSRQSEGGSSCVRRMTPVCTQERQWNASKHTAGHT